MIEQAVILSGYAVLAVAAVALVRHAHHTSRPGSTPTAYLTAVLRSSLGRWLVLLLWLWVGWHFLVR